MEGKEKERRKGERKEERKKEREGGRKLDISSKLSDSKCESNASFHKLENTIMFRHLQICR